ncbi:Assembly factor cbp4 [Aspergillus cristatus]|uniref:Cytochrome b mRNA-processing protein 4 n=1 Tax=Aspergillus cristatus TaxID=573508 RepID=A0A1E3BJJ5_ASPCR|nr:Assembly factor cbp4 [Aspergillus cristatus]
MSRGSGVTWLKMLGTAIVLCVGGPALVQSIRPTDEELFKRYNPELQKRSLEEGDRRAQEFDAYVNRLKEWSKSDKSIWFAAKEQEQQRTQQAVDTPRTKANDEARIQREEMRKELLGEK